MTNTARITDIFDIPSSFDGLASNLEELLGRVGIRDFSLNIQLPTATPGDAAPVPELALADALELLEWYEDEEEEEPPIIGIPQDVVPADPSTAITLQLQLEVAVLSEVVIDLVGLEALSFVLNPGGFEARVAMAQDKATLSFTVEVAARFSPNLLRPMRKNSAGQFERDTSRNYTQFDVGMVAVTVDSEGNFDFNRNLTFQLPHPVQIADTGLIIESGDMQLDLSDENKGLALRWTQPQLNEWLRRISPALVDKSAPEDSQMTARILFDGATLQEIRVDWTMASPRTLALPGINVVTPVNLLFTLLFGGAGRQISETALVVTLPNKDLPITLSSQFAWGRDNERELQNNRTPTTDDPFITVELTNGEALSLALLDIDLGLDDLPGFFQEFETPLVPLDFSQAEMLFQPTAANLVRLQDHWKGTLQLNADAFRMPFLEQNESNARANQFEQWLQIKPRDGKTQFDINFDEGEIALPFDIIVRFGPVQFTGDVVFGFNWETMSLSVDHESGISIATDAPTYGSDVAHLGLYWRLRGAPLDEGSDRYEYFRVVTKDYNYQIQMAQGAAFELEYREISDEPIVFLISDFVLSPNGINLTAEVSDRPARLNGIDTRFRFSGSRLEIKENTVKDLTLAGSGPLPPDLVGEAMVDVALQFKQVSGSLTLVAGSAQLQGSKPLECKGTRFQFAVDAIGLKFVFENKFHLYFTLTGSAQFVLAPGDDREGALALLPKIKIDMVECPLCADMSVLAKHVKFLVELPKPLKFSFLKAFDFELRGFGFLPQAEVLGGTGAMILSGQIFFAQGGGDIVEAKVDFHNLYIGLPKRGEFFPQIYFKRIAVQLKVGEAFALYGAVDFIDDAAMKGFAGEGMVDLKGMPQLAAAFSFVRVRRDENSNWVRAWFIYLEARKVSFMIPVIQIYIREIGLGFGYRYTIASIKAVDRENDIRKLRTELVKLSRTQAELAKVQNWDVDLEEPGQDPRWTIVFRAMIAQNSASPGALQYSEQAEANLACLFLIDAMVAFRSDLTFYMTVRGWLNTNYHGFVSNTDNVRERPLYSGFVLLSPRRKMFLMAVASNPDGYIGDRPPLPDFVKDAIRGATFSATLLITPGLLHFELGWPNKLGWKLDLGILQLDCRGGFIFRVTTKEMVIGISYEARGRLEIKADLDLGFVGVWVAAVVEVGFGARMIAALPFNNPLGTIVYGAIGLELMIQLEFGFWIKIPLGFCSVKLKFRFSLEVGFTAGVEVALGVPPQLVFGVRGQGTLWIAAMGHRLQVSANLSIRDDVVRSALEKTQHVLNLGLEATDSTELPGFAEPAGELRAMPLMASPRANEADVVDFHLPGYTIFVMRNPQPDGWGCFVLFPRGEFWEDGKLKIEPGFLPPPPLTLTFNFEAGWLDQRKVSTVLHQEIVAHEGYLLTGSAYVDVEKPGEVWVLRDRSALFRSPRYRIERESDHLNFYRGGFQYSSGTDLALGEILDELNTGQLPPALADFFTSQADNLNFDHAVVVIRAGREWELAGEEDLEERFRLRLDSRGIFTLLPLAFTVLILTAEELHAGEAPAVITRALVAHGVTLNTPTVEGTGDGVDGEWLLRGTDADGAARVYRLRHLKEMAQLELLQSVTADFALTFPNTDNLTLMQYDPMGQNWQARDAAQSFVWSAHWAAVTFSGQLFATGEDGKPSDTPQPYEMNLATYLAQAYVHAPIEAPASMAGQSIPQGDPDTDLFTATGEVQEDSRVYNPSDNAFEAAVRGAAEQFAGSPFLKLDPQNPYDGLLQAAFQPGTTIYHASGRLPDEDGAEQAIAQEQTSQNRTAMQARGMIVQDIVADLRAYADFLFKQNGSGPDGETPPLPPAALDPVTSIPFNLGLVFAYKGDTPTWLDSFDVEGEVLPKIRQRLSPIAVEPAEIAEATVETFNLRDHDFATNPPEFNRVQHYTSSNTIAITWDLTWSSRRSKTGTPRDEPNHHLAHYEVRRRVLNGRERELVYTVKPAEALHREGEGSDMRRLRPRFNIVDNFNHETPEEQAAMPAEGLSYLYTITPVDFTGEKGRPLTLVATRYPSQPPFVPANTRLVMTYEQEHLPKDRFASGAAPVPATRPHLRPAVIAPNEIELQGWDQGFDGRRGPREPASRYYLLFRKEHTLPIGSYGLDAATAVERIASRPVTNARPLPTDIRIDVTRIQNNSAALIARLQESDILPSSEWRPEAWTVFIQTESLKGVFSALVPVELIMRVKTDLPGAQPVADERQLAMLEWLAEPLYFPYLPPEDQTARTGIAHFPMPKSGSTFVGALRGIKYRPHPTGVRAIRFRWNQAPSAAPDYPLNLNAGYHLYQLDVDAHTDEVLENDRVRALRRLQEVQMIPAEDLPLVPGDTLAVNQWEAWYPSAVRRYDEAHTVATSSGDQLTPSPWYSWRESRLVWPNCQTLVEAVRDPAGAERYARLRQMHPVLENLVNDLQAKFNVDLQLYPPDLPGDLPTLLQVTAPKNDAYGWGVLQRFGLSVAFTLRDPQSGQLMLGEELLTAVNTGINTVLNKIPVDAPDGLKAVDLKRHLHVEVLFQSEQAISLQEDEVNAAAMLAIIQLSLRPRIQQWQYYRKITVRGAPGALTQIGLRIRAGTAVSLRNLSQEGVGQIDLDKPAKDQLWQQQFRLPLNGELVLAVRSAQPPDPLVPLTAGEHLAILPKLSNLVNLGVEHVATDDDKAWFLVVTRAMTDSEARDLRSELGADLAPLAERTLAIGLEAFAPQALEAAGFAVSGAMIGDMTNSPDTYLDWTTFRKYAESLSGPDAPRIRVPTGGDTLKELLPLYMAWTARFFDHGGNIEPAEGGDVVTGVGPWLATAYPRVTTPSYAAPDESGRLKYDHLLEDTWAHNYRHYILPYGRYDLLWQNLWQSPTFTAARSGPPASEIADDGLAPEQRRIPAEFPDGGLDVVLERTRPVERPLILRSGRLDRPALPGQPVPPGTTWEVIIARHTEQALIERNRTLARQVAFRQVSFALLRRFAFPAWPEALQKMVNRTLADDEFTLSVQAVESYQAYDASALPGTYPTQPDHIALGAGTTLSEAEGLSLDLPQRLAAFGQGALVLQWQALPFFYHHKLVVIAQSDSTVSPVNEVVQRDFEYISPAPISDASLSLRDANLLEARIPLNTLWESLPPEARSLWQSEKPDDEDVDAARKYAALPDPEVVYQIVESFNGNIEVQIEYLYEEKMEEGLLVQQYIARQLGKNILARGNIYIPPPDKPQGRFVLTAELENKTEGRFTPVEDVVWERPRDIPGELDGFDWPQAERWLLVWEGDLSDTQKGDLLALPGDQSFMAGVQQVVNTHASQGAGVIRVSVTLAPDPLPGDLPQRYRLQRNDDARTYTGLTWLVGPLPEAEEIAVLREWGGRTPELAQAVEMLLAQIDEWKRVGVAVPADSIAQEDLPSLLQDSMKIEGRNVSWIGAEAPTEEEVDTMLAIMASDDAMRVVRKLAELGDDAIGATLEMETAARYPRRSGLPPSLQEQLTVIPTRVEWQGGMPTAAQQPDLDRLMDDPAFGEEFNAIMRDLVERINANIRDSITVPLAVAMRPVQGELPDTIARQLLLGRQPIVAGQPIIARHLTSLLELFTHPPEKATLRRLAAATAGAVLHGRRLELRTRRGSATPSDRIPIPFDTGGE
jgi:hypothetical protein